MGLPIVINHHTARKRARILFPASSFSSLRIPPLSPPTRSDASTRPRRFRSQTTSARAPATSPRTRTGRARSATPSTRARGSSARRTATTTGPPRTRARRRPRRRRFAFPRERSSTSPPRSSATGAGGGDRPRRETRAAEVSRRKTAGAGPRSETPARAPPTPGRADPRRLVRNRNRRRPRGASAGGRAHLWG